MSKRKKSLLGLKIVSSALLLQHASANSPAFAQGQHRLQLNSVENAGRQRGGNNLRGTLAHFGVQERFNQSMQQQAMTAASIDIDLSSTVSNIMVDAGMFRRGTEVSIRTGDSTRSIQAGDMVTAAEFVSFQQAQTNRGQTLHVNADGSASGGTFSLSALSSGKQSFNIDDVVIPQTVQSVDRIGSRTDIAITGNLINFGTIAERGKHGLVSLSAHDIVNQSSGVITTLGPGNGSVDLNLTSSNDFSNDGAISSSGSLDIAAGGSLRNNGGALSAVKNVSLHSGNVVNSGNVSSRSGDITIDAPAIDGVSQCLSVNNNGGTLAALNGDIQIREAAYAGTARSLISGGDLLSEKLFLHSGGGTIDVNANQLTGEVVSSGNAVHVLASTDMLTIGNQKLDDDPTYFNSNGSITINGDILVGEALAIVASGDVIAKATVNTIQARDGGGQGYDISIIAGVDVIGGGIANETSTIPGTQSATNCAFTGVSPTGGNVDFSAAGATLQINSNSTNGGNGRNIILAAYSFDPGTGRVILPTGSNMNAGGAGAAGNITIVGGGADSNTIQLGGISNGAAAGANFVSITNSQPGFSSGTQVGFDPQGNLLAGGTIVGQDTLSTGGVSINGAILASSAVNIASGATLKVGKISTPAGVALLASDSITLGGDLSPIGGLTIVSGHDVVSAKTISFTTSSLVGNSGNLAIVAGAKFALSGGTVTISGASTTGGEIDFNTQAITGINTSNTGLFKSGGDVALIAFSGTGGTGNVTLPSASSIVTTADLAVDSGDAFIIAGKTSGNAITMGSFFGAKDSSSGKGGIGLQTADPDVSTPITYSYSGTLLAGAPFNSDAKLNKADIKAGNLTSMAHFVTIQSGNNVEVGDLILYDGSAFFSGGAVNIKTGNALLIGGTPTSNYIKSIDVSSGTTVGTRGNLLIANSGDITITPGSLKIAGGVDTGGGSFNLDAGTGNVNLDTNNIDFSGTGSTDQFGGTISLKGKNIVPLGAGPLVLSANGINNGAPGSITVELRGGASTVGLDNKDFTIHLTGGLDSSSAILNFKVASNQTLVIDPSAIDVSRLPGGNAAQITLEAGLFQAADAGKNLLISTGAVGGGFGGGLTLRQTSGSLLTIGTGIGQISLSAQGGPNDGAGGLITVSSKGDLTVFGNAVNVHGGGTNSDSGGINLTAGDGGTGNLVVVGDIDVSGTGSGLVGQVALESNSATAFNIGAKKGVNGLLGKVLGTGASLTVRNKTGGITTSADIGGFGELLLDAAGGTGVAINKLLGDSNALTITISAGGSGNITSKKLITALNLGFTTNTGYVGGKKALKISADKVSGTTGGALNLLNSKTTKVAVDTSTSTNGDFKFVGAGDIQISGDISGKNVSISTTGTGATIDLGTNRQITADPTSGVVSILAGTKSGGSIVTGGSTTGISAFAVSFDGVNMGSFANPIDVDTQNLSFTSLGDVHINSHGAKLLNLNDSTVTGNFNLTAVSDVSVNTSFGAVAQLQLITTGDVAINSNIASTKTASKVTLQSNLGDLVQISNKFKIGANTGSTVSLNADVGNVGAAGAAIRVDSAGTISVNNNSANGGVNVDSLTKGTVVFGAASAGKLVFTSQGPTDLTDVQANSISITNAGGQLQVIAGRTIESFDGGITLNNLGKGKGSSIITGQNSLIRSFAKVAGDGEIDLVIGTLPPPQVAGTAPAKVMVVENGGTVFFNDGITFNGTIAFIKATNTNVIFSAGKAGPGAIVLGEGAAIEADPPMPAPISALITVETTGGGRHRSAPMLSAPLSVPQVEADELSRFESLNDGGVTVATIPNGLSAVSPNQLNAGLSDEEGALGTPLQSFMRTGWLSETPGHTSMRADWMRETELENGTIPATLEILDDTTGSASLSNGSILVAPAKDVLIHTPFGEVQIAAKSLVLLMAFRDGVAVYNFDDVSREAVSIVSGGRKLTLAPSQSAVVTHDSVEALAEINPAQAIAHRSVNERKFGNGYKAFHSEFSIPSALAAVLPIKELMNSQHPHAVRTSKHLLKTTSILLQLQSGGARFNRHVKPQKVCLTAKAI